MYITQLRRTTMDCYYEMDDGTDFEFKGWEKIYDETFYSYFTLLKHRTCRLDNLEVDSFDYLTYRDMCLVMIRALLIESERLKENYTLQNFLIKHNRADLKLQVDNYLNQNINSMLTLRKALKISVDKFIAHNDTLVKEYPSGEKQFCTEDFALRYLFLSDISRADYPFSISKITNFIGNILNQIPENEIIEPNSIA